VSEPDSGLEPLLAFPSELPASEVALAPVAARPGWHLIAAGALAATACIAAGLFVWQQWGGSRLAVGTGDLIVQTQPSGADVLVDGERRGVSPLTLPLRPGEHTVLVRHGAIERSAPVTVIAGSSAAQYFEIAVPAAPVASGALSVVTTPAGARVLVDGQLRGVSPLTISDLVSGEHRVTVERDAARSSRAVSVAGGTTTSVLFALAGEAGPVGGWLTVNAPFDVQVHEGADVVGASSTPRIMLAAGRHELTIANSVLGFSQPQRVDIVAGRVTTLQIVPPRVQLNVNARPWADVAIDGAEAGQTPIANLPIAVGTHQIVFRHPQFGERRQTVTVTATGANRVAIDMTR
jgi:hypothetical protein